MAKIIPKGEIDLLRPQLSIGWAYKAILVVVLLLTVIGVGTFSFEKVKGVLGGVLPGHVSEDF